MNAMNQAKVKVISWTAGNGDKITLGIKNGSYEASVFTSGGYSHAAALIPATGSAKKAGAVMKLGRVGIKAEQWNEVKDFYAPFDVDAAARKLAGKVEVFVGDRHVAMDKIEAAEYRGF